MRFQYVYEELTKTIGKLENKARFDYKFLKCSQNILLYFSFSF